MGPMRFLCAKSLANISDVIAHTIYEVRTYEIFYLPSSQYSPQYSILSLECSVLSILCTVSSVLCSVSSPQSLRSVSCVLCPAFYVLCSVFCVATLCVILCVLY
jgi:hypothetical protein